MLLPEFIRSLSEYAQQLFTLNPDEPFKTGGKVVAIAGTLVTLITTLSTKTYPWLRSKLDSRSVSKRIGAELYTRASIERAVRYYILPFCQALDPAGAEEPRLVSNPKQKLFDYLDEALEHPTEYNFIILLADSGMGKTSSLLNYYVRHIRHWRKPYKLVLIPLGIPDADDRIAAVTDKHETVLFLDALDEDTLAIIDHVERLRILLTATRDFHRVLISCRTQFFSKDEEIPKETGKIKVGSRAAGEPAEYVFHKIYLSPFTDRQVTEYLKHRYPIWQWRSRQRARAMAEKIPHLTARPMLLAHIDDLVQANRQIHYSFELYEEMVEAWLTREQGFIQNKNDLRQFSERLAVDLYVNRAERGSERIPKSELSKLAAEWKIPLDEWKLSGRSLLNRDVDGNYKFAHRSIMEYLCVHHFIQGDDRCAEVDWTDQMEVFLWDMLLNAVKQHTPLKDFFNALEEGEGDVWLEVITKLSRRGLKSLSIVPFAMSSETVADVVAQLILMLIHEQVFEPSYVFLYRVEPGNKMRIIADQRNDALLPIDRFRAEENVVRSSVIHFLEQHWLLLTRHTPVYEDEEKLAAYRISSDDETGVYYILVVNVSTSEEFERFNDFFIKEVLPHE